MLPALELGCGGARGGNRAPDLIICDVYLADGSALRILEGDAPPVTRAVKIAMSHASAEEAFRLAGSAVGLIA